MANGMTHARLARGARRAWPLAAFLGALLGAAVALAAAAERGVEQSLKVSWTGLGAERVKTVPIAKNSGGKPRVVMSLGPDQVGSIDPGDAVWGGGEVEVSVTCLERMPQCVGKLYDYSPHVKARLVLADSAKSAGGGTMTIGTPTHLRCSQKLPNRNHHCVLAVAGRRNLSENRNLPCSRCFVNLIVDAYHPGARKGNVLVVGTDTDHGISQDKGMLNAGVFDPGPVPRVKPLLQRHRFARKLPVGGFRSGAGSQKKVVFSRRVDALEAGEQLLVEARVKVKTGHLPYGTLLQSQMVLSEKPGSIKRVGVPQKMASQHGVVTAMNGFNCTRGRSGHSSPCVIRKYGVVRANHDARVRPKQGEGPFVPLYVNLFMQSQAQFGGERHRPGHAAKIAKVGSLKVYRFGPEFQR